jgi:hypothetical protein
MKRFIVLLGLLCAFSFAAMAQDGMEMKATEQDKTAAIPTDGFLKRGAPLGNAKEVSLAKIIDNPAAYAGQTVRINGVIVSSCKMEGCWMQIAPKAGAEGVMVQFKDHKFFIPLKSAGATAKAEGTVQVKTLTKAEVDHLINEDGAKYDKRNADGSVTEVTFIASGVELTKATK